MNREGLAGLRNVIRAAEIKAMHQPAMCVVYKRGREVACLGLQAYRLQVGRAASSHTYTCAAYLCKRLTSA